MSQQSAVLFPDAPIPYNKMWIRSLDETRTKVVTQLPSCIDVVNDSLFPTMSLSSSTEDDDILSIDKSSYKCPNCNKSLAEKRDWYSLEPKYGKRTLLYFCGTRCMRELARYY